MRQTHILKPLVQRGWAFLFIIAPFLLFICLASQAEAGLLNILRKASKNIDADGLSINPRLDFSDLKKIKVKKGTARVAVSTRSDGTLVLVAESGKQIVLDSSQDIRPILKNLKDASRTADGKKVKELKFFTNEKSLFEHAKSHSLFAQLDNLNLVSSKGKILPLKAMTKGSGDHVFGVNVSKRTVVLASNGQQMKEALWRMGRGMNRGDVHLVSFDGTARSTPNLLPVLTNGMPKPTLINPKKLNEALRTLRGKTLIVSGKVEGTDLVVDSAKDGRHVIQFDELKQLAAREDIDLFIVGKRSPKQPAVKTWFGSPFESQMKKAFQANTYGDFLSALHGEKKLLTIDTKLAANNRLTFQSLSGESVEKLGGLTSFIKEIDIVGALAGRVVSKLSEISLDLNVKDKERASELNARIIPGVPSILQYLYIANIIFGFVGWTVSRWVWHKIWPPRARTDFSSLISFIGMKLLRFAVFVFGLLGLFGLLFAALFGFKQVFDWVVVIWLIVTWPFRTLFRVLKST